LPGRKAVLAAALPALLALALLAVLPVGCRNSQRRSTAEESLSRAIAVVNNEKIAYEDFLNDYQLFLTRWDPFIKNDPAKKQEIKEILLERIIDGRLMDQEARRKGITVDDNELNARMLEIFFTSEELPGEGVESLLGREDLVGWSLEFKRRLIHEKVVRAEVIDKLRLTPAELRTYYQKHLESFFRPERVKVRHIAVGSRSLYNRVLGLLDRRVDFVELVRKYSITPDRMADGELGFVERGVLPKEFDKAIFAMTQVGSVGPREEPVQTEMGYHIFRLEGHQPEGQLGFRDAMPEVRQRLVAEKEQEAYRAWLAELRDKATIFIDNALLNTE
jgi:parvulin-like peptidyl-prolyl isomerase